MLPELAEGAEGGSGTKAQVASGLWPLATSEACEGPCGRDGSRAEKKHQVPEQHHGRGWQSPGWWESSSPGLVLRVSWQAADSQSCPRPSLSSQGTGLFRTQGTASS